MENNLSISNVNFSYGNKKILNNISCNCNNGITALLGNNGAGKTTLMKIITGLKKPKSGKIELNGKDLLYAQNIGLNEIGYLPQNFDIYPNVLGYDFLSYVCDIKNIDKHKKEKILEEVIYKFNLNEVIKRPVSKYSGGYKRRLGIAQAVLGDSKLIIIDEPTVGLDPEQRLEFRHYLSEIGHDRITLISTHIIEDAELYSDNVLVINNGSIKFNGSVSDIIGKSAPNIYSVICNVENLKEIRKSVVVIEEKRLNNKEVKIKFIKNSCEINNSKPEKEVSLENAYVYIQKQQGIL
ncbi:ATP-binding cassette domain-containing protein [Clostridium weizhouense]|uniref:ATP-binding cassette domain-containing protein n=1 Tax=Clostridium weizhouense TaxID=2859781 RepID=A0ABS7ASK4_9CLOT|nr:ATP-binding cassette domain-containing protein [Clostridium weizhouense]MBW6411648.1 ATP-binding cassette domain-containing protein [Clostridium weizhouense]